MPIYAEKLGGIAGMWCMGTFGAWLLGVRLRLSVEGTDEPAVAAALSTIEQTEGV
jgi:hypothetical protein